MQENFISNMTLQELQLYVKSVNLYLEKVHKKFGFKGEIKPNEVRVLIYLLFNSDRWLTQTQMVQENSEDKWLLSSVCKSINKLDSLGFLEKRISSRDIDSRNIAEYRVKLDYFAKNNQ